MRNLMRRGKPEPAPLNVPEPDSSIIAAANATIADLRDDLDDRAEQIAGLRDRCDDLFATVRRKDEQIEALRQEDRTAEALLATLRRQLAEAAEEVKSTAAHCRRALDERDALRDRIAAAVIALRPMAKLKGPTVADRARVVAQVIIGLEAGDPQESAP